MNKRKKKLLIAEEKFKSDFAPLAGFYDYHIKGKKISVDLADIQEYGIALTPQTLKDIASIDDDAISVNTINFSSTKKKQNVKNLAWAIRCLISHPENIKEKEVKGTKCYYICCSMKNRKTGVKSPTMKGLVACDLWTIFTGQLINKIKEKEL